MIMIKSPSLEHPSSVRVGTWDRRKHGLMKKLMCDHVRFTALTGLAEWNSWNESFQCFYRNDFTFMSEKYP